MRVAVARGREHFLIVVLWPKPHVKTLGGLTQMRWGPDDCSAIFGGRLGYSFWVVVWSVFEVANFRSLVLLFKKDEGGEWVGWSGVLPASHSPTPTNYFQSPPPHQTRHIWNAQQMASLETKKKKDRRNKNNSKSYKISPCTWMGQCPLPQSEFFWELLLHRAKGCFICKDTGTYPI